MPLTIVSGGCPSPTVPKQRQLMLMMLAGLSCVEQDRPRIKDSVAHANIACFGCLPQPNWTVQLMLVMFARICKVWDISRKGFSS